MATAALAAAAVLSGLGFTIPFLERYRCACEQEDDARRAALDYNQRRRKEAPRTPWLSANNAPPRPAPPPLSSASFTSEVLGVVLPATAPHATTASTTTVMLGPAISDSVLCLPVQDQQQLQQKQQRQDLPDERVEWISPDNCCSLVQYSNNEQQAMSQLPPHLRQYVDPSYVPPPPPKTESVSTTGPKPWYDWRRTDDNCQQVGERQNPGSVAWSDPRHAPQDRFEYIDQPTVKLARTLGNDEGVKVQGNTVHHPTGRPYKSYPHSGREADNYLRRMTGHDPHRKARAPVLNPTLMPDLPEGHVPGGGRFLTERERDMNAALNPNTIGDGMLPFIRPDIHQWQEKPVSYKKPTVQVREPIIPDSRAGWWKEPNDIGGRRMYDNALPVTIGSGDGCGIPVPGDRHDVGVQHMPREAKHRAVLKRDVTTERPAPLRPDEELPIPKGMEPKTYTAIKTDHKKLKQPETLAYGAAYAASDEANYDPTVGHFGADLSGEKSKQRMSGLTASLKGHGAGYEESIGSSVLPSVGTGKPADALKRVALRQMHAQNRARPVADDEGLGAAADGAHVGRAARPSVDRRGVERAPLHQSYRAQSDANVEPGSHADRAGGVSVQRPGTERPIHSRNVLDDTVCDSALQQGVSIRSADDTKQRRVQVRERRQQHVPVGSIAEALGDGQGADSAAYGALSTEARGARRNERARYREQHAVPSEHGTNILATDGDLVGAHCARVGADPIGVRAGQRREARRLEQVQIGQATGETGTEVENHSLAGGTRAHFDASRAAKFQAREHYAPPVLRADDQRFEDPSSTIHRMAAARAGDSVVRSEALEKRRSALQAQAGLELARRRALSDDQWSQADISAPSTTARAPALQRERIATHTRSDYRLDAHETDHRAMGPSPTLVRAIGPRLDMRERSRTHAPRPTGTITEDLVDAPHQSMATGAWRDRSRSQGREKGMQRRREDLWREVLENEDGEGIADHVDVGRIRARGEGNDKRLETRNMGRYDDVGAGDAALSRAATSGVDVLQTERGKRPGRLERLNGLDAHRLQVETRGGEGDGVADSAAVTMSVSSNLRELYTRRGERREQIRSQHAPPRGDNADHVFEATHWDEGVGTQQHRPDRSWREETLMARVDNPDSDALDNPIFQGSGVGGVRDQPTERFLLRERRGMDSPTKGRLDDIEDKIIQSHVDPGSVRCDKPMVQVREEQRALGMRNRLRAETPPPENVLRTNTRFRAMNAGGRFARGKAMTPPPPGSPRRCDSPVYRGAKVCPF